MKINKDLVEKAYKKLKSSVYYDKTQLILRNRIVEFEMEHQGKELDAYLEDKIYRALLDQKSFEKLKYEICDGINVTALPKKLKDSKEDECRTEARIFFNSEIKNVCVDEFQYYIDMPVEGHILGVLWIMLVGYRIDKKIYRHSYGNRINKRLLSEINEEPSYSPLLFEPYYEQYESWQDKALSEAHDYMKKGQDVIIITTDFRRYYYSLNVDSKVMNEMLDSVEDEIKDDETRACCIELNKFVEKVIDRYSYEYFFLNCSLKNGMTCDRCPVKDVCNNENYALPIGFLPSNIIGNWCLHRFDKAVVDGWNPVYYGRYVDDILIVDKVEENSELSEKVKSGQLTSDDVISFFLTSCSRWNGLSVSDSCQKESENKAIFIKEEKEKDFISESRKESGVSQEIVYTLNPRYNPVEGNLSRIKIHNGKVKIFYFKHDESDALITCFKSNIAKNKSEFRYMPDEEALFQRDDYSSIYSLSNTDTINKFRGIDGISFDKYELSKFLGKCLRISVMIQDRIESRFEKDILKIFDRLTLIENYTMWEKILEILVVNENFDALVSFCRMINDALERMDFAKGLPDHLKSNVLYSMYSTLHSGLCRSLALVWKPESRSCMHEIYDAFLKSKLNELVTGPYNPKRTIDDQRIGNIIKWYCESRMIDKSVLSIPLDMVLDSIGFDRQIHGEGINLSSFSEVLNNTSDLRTSDYKYYPYYIDMHEINLASCIEQVNLDPGKQQPFEDLNLTHENEVKLYYKFNHPDIDLNPNDYKAVQVEMFNDNEHVYYIAVGNKKKKELKVALANVRIDHKNIKRIVMGDLDRSGRRYSDLSNIVNMAIDHKVDILIMPETYVPFDWLSALAVKAKNSKLAIVTGVEHIKKDKRIYNMTAVILPYEDSGRRNACIKFHIKKYYAPIEEEMIKGYRLQPVTGCNYELYKWNDCYFPVYCCFELTSIVDRALFKSYADMLIAVEWNRDVSYYSNILESMSRDLHCYCIQVNSSDYGDSRITKPSKSEDKDLLRTKGGINSNILIETINIHDLREFQVKGFSMQQEADTFKVTPADFNKEIVEKKIKGQDIDY